MAINIQSDYYILEEKNKNEGYICPNSGFYKLVSSANYFGEIMEWFGYALTTMNYY